MIRRPPRSTQSRSSAASDVYKRQIGYGAHAREPQRVVPFYPAFIAGMNLVRLAQDAFSFLVGWEFMSLASWALVVSEDTSEDNRRAAIVYLIMATGGALTLLL